MSNLAFTYQFHGRWKEAKEPFVQIMETSVRVLGWEHLDTLTSMANLALMYRGQWQWKEAEELEVQVTETRERVLGLEHPDTLASMNNLAFTLKREKRERERERERERGPRPQRRGYITDGNLLATEETSPWLSVSLHITVACKPASPFESSETSVVQGVPDILLGNYKQSDDKDPEHLSNQL